MPGGLQRAARGCLDVAVSMAGPVILSPVLLTLAILVRIATGKPVFFRQERPGKNGKLFTLFKLRTMTNMHGGDGGLLPDTQRLTKLGRFLRRWSLDELPQLWNVLKGEMSLVEPRPLLVEYHPGGKALPLRDAMS